MQFLFSMFDTANGWLIAQLGDLGPLIAAGALGLVLIAITLPLMVFRKQDPLDRIKSRRKTPQDTAMPTVLRRADKKDKRLDRFAQYLEPQDRAQFSAIQMTLLRAGYRNKSAVQMFHFAQLVLGIGGFALGLVIVMVVIGDASTQNSVLGVLIPGCAGYFAPKYLVHRRLQTRTEDITCAFPDALDLMLVCVEAGQSLDQAIIRVARELRTGYPALSEEFEIVAHEMKAGKDKTRVLRDMADRVGVQDVSSFVTTLIQSATFGTSVADALRIYAGEMREKRVMRAEEKANKLPTKLTLGTMIFCLPPLLVILIGPSIYGIAQNLQGM